MTDRSKKFELLEEHIESVIDHCREAGIIVCDYQPGVAFHKKINDLVLKLQDVDRMQQDVQDVLVPIAVFSKIDAGQNPQIYSRECMERVIAHNEVVRGKLESLRRFRYLLMAELSKRFPGEMANYRSMRDDAEPSQQSSQPNSNDNLLQTGGSSSDTGLESILPPAR
ncbi:unnamed protein product [Hydatigera taeniaeformis]|uniref:Mediator of RNA polymerase II transcription subunit 10 n=1 Tax=Hydatigena taeniaeformis TaxID=6205 RepID=A0A0R3WQW4_HYDTA|nr:unnamed protein product [Hydatigera taeniaeformis]